MKKYLLFILALVFVVSIAVPAMAATFFVDVPANHWSYASVTKLAQAGIIDGYGDGTFIGNNTISRYEMAQITARAMANRDKADAALKAQIEKLAAEFADELDSLGVRVAKLEKNSDNVKITGEVRFSNHNYDNANGDKSMLRTRLWLFGQINDSWKYVSMIEHNGHDLKTNYNEVDKIRLRRGWIEGSIGDINMVAGRYYYKPVGGIVFDEDGDGIKFNYSKNNWKFDLFAIRPTFNNSAIKGAGKNQVYGLVVGYDWTKLNATGVYYRTNASLKDVDNSNIYEFALTYKFDKNWKVFAEYLRGSKEVLNGGKSGWVVRLDWSNINRNKPNTFAIRAAYYDVPAAAIINTTAKLDFGSSLYSNFDGYKGWQVGARWMVAKNIDVNIDYYDFKGQESRANRNNDSLLWTYVRFYF